VANCRRYAQNAGGGGALDLTVTVRLSHITVSVPFNLSPERSDWDCLPVTLTLCCDGLHGTLRSTQPLHSKMPATAVHLSRQPPL